jgi:hypothetical protein
VENLGNNMFLIFGMLILGIFLELFLMYKNHAVTRWSQTKGELLKSDVGLEHSASSGLVAKVNYQYTVNGKEFQSTKIAYATLGSMFAVFKGLYIKKDDLTVYFNPLKPEIAVIVPGIRLFHILDIAFIIGLMFYLSSVFGL